MGITNLLSATAGVMKYIPRKITAKVISGMLQGPLMESISIDFRLKEDKPILDGLRF